MNEEEFKKYLKANFPRTSSFLSGFMLFLVDIFTLIFCIAAGFFIINLFATSDINFKSFINYSVFLPINLIIFAIMGLYPGIMIPAAEEVKKYCVSTFFSFAAIVLSIFFSDLTDTNLTKNITKDSQDFEIMLAFAIAFLFATILLPAFREYSKRILGKKKWWGIPAVIYSSGDSADEVIDRLVKHTYLGYRPAVIIDGLATAPYSYNDIPVFPASNNKIIDIIHTYNIKNAVICDYQQDITPIMTTYRYTISVSKKQTSFTCTQHLKDIAGIIGFASLHNLTFKSNLFIKRTLDLLLILIALPILIPVFIILSLAVKLTSKGPVFYRHERIGKNGKKIKCWKFRSMKINSQEMLKEILENDPVRRAEWEAERKFKDDPRVTKFGKFLRKTSLDELPQLFNVLAGEMSFVGPRPVTAEEIEMYGDYKDFVLSVLPGISGMWQVSGRSDATYEERIVFDTYYIQNWSIWLDLWILIKTVYVVLRRKGAY